jgi:hypothetical protein
MINYVRQNDTTQYAMSCLNDTIQNDTCQKIQLNNMVLEAMIMIHMIVTMKIDIITIYQK